MLPSRREWLWLLGSLFVWALVVIFIQKPGVAIGGFDDHQSHLAETRIFFQQGLGLYRHPGEAFCGASHGGAEGVGQSGCFARDACEIEGPRPHVCLNWQPRFRPYPLGSVLYAIPEALLSRFTRFTAQSINRFIIWKYVLGAHLLLWALYRALVAPPGVDEPVDERPSPWLAWGLFACAYVEVMLWSLEGLYDAFAASFIVLGAIMLRRGARATAFVAIAAAIFFHYRALWYIPLLGLSAMGFVGREAWVRPVPAAAKLFLGAGLLGVSAFTFALTYGDLHNFPDQNPVHWVHWLPPSSLWDLLGPMALVIAYLVHARHWRLVALMVWQLFMLVQTPQVMWWHLLFLLPMLAVARLERGFHPVAATAVWLGAQALVVYRAPFPHFGRLLFHLADALGHHGS